MSGTLELCALDVSGRKTAPATGRSLAERVGGETPSFESRSFRADRFGR